MIIFDFVNIKVSAWTGDIGQWSSVAECLPCMCEAKGLIPKKNERKKKRKKKSIILKLTGNKKFLVKKTGLGA